jgi:hypothetical protein
MNCIKHLLLLACLLAGATSTALAQTATVVEMKKAGKLESQLKKLDTKSIQSLQINGPFNCKDWDYFLTLQFGNLQTLDLSNATFVDESSSTLHHLTFPPTTDRRAQQSYGDFNAINSLKIFKKAVDKKGNVISPSIEITKQLKSLYTPYSMRITAYADTIVVYEEASYGKYRLNNAYSQYLLLPQQSLVDITKDPSKSYNNEDKLALPTGYRYERNGNIPLVIITRDQHLYINLAPEQFDLSKYANYTLDFVGANGFEGSTLSSITWPSNLTSVPHDCFKDCKNLTSFNAPNVVSIEDGAFSGCSSLSQISCPKIETIGAYAFENTQIKELQLPASIKSLSSLAFANSAIENIELIGQYPPEIIKGNDKKAHRDVSDLQYSGTVIVPEGKFDAYYIGSYKKVNLVEKGAKTEFTFNVKKAGTLASYITDDIASRIGSLVLTGQLYDTDFEAINKCVNLKSLDLSHTFIVLSPETVKKKRNEDKMVLQMLSNAATMASADANAKFNAGVGSSSDVAYTESVSKMFDVALAKLDQEDITASDACIMPSLNSETLTHLSYLVLPLQLKNLKMFFQSNRQPLELVLPPKLETIGTRALRNMSISKINFPSTLKELGEYAFAHSTISNIDFKGTQITVIPKGAFVGCNNLTSVDFRGTKVEELKFGAFGHNSKLVEMRFNPNTKFAYRALNGDSDSWSNNSEKRTQKLTLYIYNREKPADIIFYGEIKEIHIPRGCKAGWPINDSKIEIIDDLDY